MEERPNKRQRITYPLTLQGQNCPSGKRKVRSKAEHLAVEQGKLVECVNTLSLEDFRQMFSPECLRAATKLSSSADFGDLIVDSIDAQSPLVLLQCFSLVQVTSQDDYAKSELKWSSAKKKKEMQLPDLKYFVLMTRRSLVAGFISFMVTYEDGHEVLYVYEVHLAQPEQGKGLGPKLMEVAEQVGRNVGLEKVMLTVFRSNARAIGMYEKLGYSEDEYSPEPKQLRNGTLKESGYVILSKNLKTKAKEQD